MGSCLLASQLCVAENKFEMSKVIVSAKAPVDATKFAGSVTVVTGEDIRASGATSVTEVLETTPGVQLVVTGSSSTKAPQLRGQDTDQVLVLVNGKRLPNTDRNLPFAPAFRYNWVPVANIERIEVIRGPASSLYGADALAGVINIITRKAEQEWRGNLALYTKQTDDANGGDGEGISLAASGSISQQVDLALALESTNRDAIFDDDDLLTLQSEKETESLQADLGIDLNENNRLQFGLLYGNEEGEDIDNGFRGVGSIPLDVKRRRGTIDYETRIGKFATNIGVVASNSDVEEGTSIWEITENGASFDIQGELSQAQYLSAGIQYREEEAERRDSIIFDDSIDATTLFIQDVIDINASNKLTLGLAYDKHSKYDNETSPKINWFSQLSSNWGIKAGYGESYLAPSLREGSSAYIVPAGPTRTYIGNDDLQPETGQTVELGLTYNKGNIVGSVTLFRTEIDDLISLIDTVDNTGPFPVTTAEYNNIDEALIQGLETDWSFYSKNKETKFNISYTYLDTENRSEENKGKQLTDRAEHTAKINIQHRLSQWGIRLDAGVRYLSDQYTNVDNTEEIESYSVADIGISKTLFGDTQLRLGIDNVGNKTVLDESAFELLEEGRSFKLTLSSTF